MRDSLTPGTDIAWGFLFFSRLSLQWAAAVQAFFNFVFKRGVGILFVSFFSKPSVTRIWVYIGNLQFSGRNFSCKCLWDDSCLRLFSSLSQVCSFIQLILRTLLALTTLITLWFSCRCLHGSFQAQGREQFCLWAWAALGLGPCPAHRLSFLLCKEAASPPAASVAPSRNEIVFVWFVVVVWRLMQIQVQVMGNIMWKLSKSISVESVYLPTSS